MSAFGQSFVLKGIVSSADGELLPGVNVKIQGTTVGTITDIDGKYSIKAPDNSTLVFSYVGMETHEVKIGKQSVVNVVMKPSSIMVDEVVVTTGYQTIERGRATGSFDVVKSKDLQMVVSNDVVDKLEGVVPGLALDGEGDNLC